MTAATKNKKGYSLIELLIAMAISVIIILAVVTIFATVVKIRNNARTSQQKLEDARSAMELMAKTLRMAADVSITNQYNTDGTFDTIKFYDGSSQCISYSKNSSGQIQMAVAAATVGGNGNIDPETACDGVSYGSPLPYTSTAVDSNGLSFTLVPNPQTPKTVMGRATMIMKIGGKNMETTVSFRDYSPIN